MANTFAGTKGSTIDNNPNTGLPFDVQTSFLSDFFADSGLRIGNNLDAGFGALYTRDVATEIVMYKPIDFVADTLSQLFSKFRTTNKVAVEWYETDMLLPHQAAGLAGVPSTTATINGTGANASYSPGATGKTFTVASGLGAYFRKDDKVRYPVSSTAWQYAVVTDITGDVLTLASNDAGNLAAAASETSKIDIIGSIRNIERNIEVRSRGTSGNMKYTYVENIVHEKSFSRFAKLNDKYVDVYQENQEKLYNAYRLNRALNTYYGKIGKRQVTLPDGTVDWAYASPGIWDLVYNFSRLESDMTTNGFFDANKFKTAIQRWIAYNFGAESGGPKQRTVLNSAKFGGYLSYAYEDKQNFYGQEYVAGILCSRYVDNLGIADFMHDPMLELFHPIPNGSLKDGTGVAVALMVPFDECVTRVQFEGGGPRTEEFKKNGGDRDMHMRIESIEGIQMSNLQYCSALVESEITTD